MEHVNVLLDIVTSKVTEVAQSDVVVGEPITLGDITLVPLSRVSLGFGGGGGQGEGTNARRPGRRRGKRRGGDTDEAELEMGEGKGAGGGAGGAGKVRPVAVIVFSKEGITIEPIPDKKGAFDRVMDKVPELIDLVKDAVHR
jgi:uncharacterized spore protein YtfJ